MEGTISGLAAELNELFNRVDDVLNRIEILFSSEECRKCVKGLPVPSLLVFSSLLTMMREAPPEEPIPETTQEAATEPNDHRQATASVNCYREATVPVSVHRGAPLSDDNSSSDRGAEISQPEINNNASNPDPRRDLYHPPSISTSLHNALVENHGNPQSFLRAIHRTSTGSTSGLTGAFFRLQHNCQDIQPDGTRELYLQFYSLHRRLELRNIFLLAKELGYHTGKKWCRNACQQLAAKIKSKHPALQADSLLDEYVRLGCAYNKWAEELGGPGFLLVLPLTITEYQ
jgi:hypothetical protein